MGKNYTPAKPGDKAYPDQDALKKAQVSSFQLSGDQRADLEAKRKERENRETKEQEDASRLIAEQKKQRIAEDAAFNKALSTGLRLQSTEDIRKQALKDKDALKLQDLERKEQERADRVNTNIERMPRVKAVMEKMKYLDPNSPEYKAYAQHLEDIYDSAYKQAGIKRPRISLPELKLPTPKEEGSWWDKLFGGSSAPSAD